MPASRPAMIPKAAASAADSVCIDLEDAVAPDEKPASRANVVRALKEIDFGRRVRMVASRMPRAPRGTRRRTK